MERKWLFGAAGAFIAVVAALLLARPLGFLATRMTVEEYRQHAADGSMRSFIVTGQIAGSRATGTRTEVAGAYQVTFGGGLELRTPDGRTMHRLELASGKGPNAAVYFDPTEIKPGAPGSQVEIRGRFESIQTAARFGPPQKFSYGIARSMVVVQK